MKPSESPSDFPADCSDWVARQEGCSRSDLAGRLEQIWRHLVKTTEEIYAELHVRQSTTPDAVVVQRVWNCVYCHWRRASEQASLSFEAVLELVHSASGGEGAGEHSILKDVVFAQALQNGDGWAAERFETEYMPIVRAVARRAGGQRAMDRVDNFAAELILPRDQRPPRIAGFQGRTTLKAWLRAVVANYCISDFRKQREVTLEAEIDRSVDVETEELADQSQCETLLRPVFQQVVGVLEHEDRVLITMLILDNVPQKNLATSLGINSGNVTRRRQRIVQSLCDQMADLAAREQAEQSFSDCLDLILTGRDRALRERLSEVLAGGFRSSSSSEIQEG
ncbi:sigma-70 family RNA polymerase sigma factor [bacterium]|nr:sigma-70 family RNA polymerase sigma factor [bacterium]